MGQIQLEVGGKYLNRLGQEINIIKHTPGLVHEFWDQYRQSYTKNGVFDSGYFPSNLDLVREVTVQTTKQE